MAFLHRDLKLFGTSGIRGLTNIEISPEFTLRIAEAFGYYIGPGRTVVVGRDTRRGSETLQAAAMTGLASVGVDVQDCGCLPMGGLLHYLVRSGSHGGLMITGSFLPHDRISIVLLNEDGTYIGPETALRIENIFFTSTANKERLSPESLGAVERTNVLAPYLNDLLSLVQTELIEERAMRVVVDPGYGTASIIMSSLLKKIGVDVVTVNDTPNEPQARRRRKVEDRFKQTAISVVKTKAEIGIAFDTDADRVAFFDPDGKLISGDYIAAIFAKEMLRRGDTCVAPVNSSTLISHVCTRLRANVVPCPVGQYYIGAALRRNPRAKFAYDRSGKYFFPQYAKWSDGMLTALMMLEILSKPRVSLEKLLNSFPDFFQRSAVIPCDPRAKSAVMEHVPQMWTTLDKGRYIKKVDIDGLKRHYEDFSWLLIRPSGTEPAIRVHSDAMNYARARDLCVMGEKIVRRAMKLA